VRGGRLASIVLAVVLGAGLVAVSAGAAPSQSRPPGSPDLAAMALSTADFPTGARVIGQRYVRDPDFVATYERELSLGGTQVGRSLLFWAFHGLTVEEDAAAAVATLAGLKRALRAKRFRTSFAAIIAEAADLPTRAVLVAKPRSPRIGQGAVSLSITIRAQGTSAHLLMTFFRLDRVEGTLMLLAVPGRKVRNADADRVARVAVERMRAGLVPALAAPPVVTGTLNPGQILTAVPGTWRGDQVELAYQWERCVEAATGCTPIVNATGPTYSVGANDLASTLRVSVTGRNRLGSATGPSAPTGVVTGPAGAPVATVAPVVEGVIGPGATLTATTGTWSGAPASFAYQWRRCNATTSACVDVADATASTYTLSAADSGSVLRVLVVATNPAGSGGAISTPTAGPAPLAP
jgi:hypothetical protein